MTDKTIARLGISAPDLRRTWLFGPGARVAARAAMRDSGADALIVDLEDFTPPARREEARRDLGALIASWRESAVGVDGEAGGRARVACVRINALDADGPLDLAAAMPARPDVIAYPMASSPRQMADLHAALDRWERDIGIPRDITEILPVCETALGVVEVRAIAAGSSRIRAALLGAEDLAADLGAERGVDAVELDHARRRFVVECRAAGIEPVDAPYTFSDADGAGREAAYARRLGYRSKAVVRAGHVRAINGVLTPGPDELQRARRLVASFDAARERGEERVLVDDLWVEVPTYRNARRLLERAQRLGVEAPDE